MQVYLYKKECILSMCCFFRFAIVKNNEDILLGIKQFHDSTSIKSHVADHGSSGI